MVVKSKSAVHPLCKKENEPMRLYQCLILCFITVSLFTITLPAISANQVTNARVATSYGKLPLSFVENKGQMDKRARFVIRGPRASAFFRNDGVTFDLWEASKIKSLDKRDMKAEKPSKSEVRKHAVLKLTFKGANPKCQVKGMDTLSGKVNYMIGKDKSKWHTDVPTYKGVTYRNIWHGIDIMYRGDRRQLKYDIRVNPGADIKMVRLQYDGAQRMWLDKKGDLHIKTAVTEFIEKVPGIYQEKAGKRINVSGGYKLLNRNTVGFSVNNVDLTLPLVIDPATDLIYSTYLGGKFDESGNGIAVDSYGCAYITGETISTDFPITPGAYDNTPQGDAFIVKLNASGTKILYSTAFGGQTTDEGMAIAVDAYGCVYLTGDTRSYNFPTTPGAFDESYNEYGDAFVAKLNPYGNKLIYSTILGGSSFGGGIGIDTGFDIAVDSSGCAYVCGSTYSRDFPTTSGAYAESPEGGNSDGFITKLNPAGSKLEYSTFLGGTSGENINSIKVDDYGNAYVTGSTTSSDFPTTLGAYDTTANGNGDAFFTELDSTGSNLVYSSFIGGTGHDNAHSIALDSSGCIYVTGSTDSRHFPITVGAFDTTWNGDYDAFVFKFDIPNNQLIYSTMLGGAKYDGGNSIAVDQSGCAYIAGTTLSSTFPSTPGTFHSTYRAAAEGPIYDKTDVFVTKLDSDGSRVMYSAFLGGTYTDIVNGMAIDPTGYVYITGQTDSPDFSATVNAYDKVYNGGNYDSYVTRIWANQAPVNASLTPNTETIAIDLKTTLISVYWDAAGYNNIRSCYLMFNTGTTTSGAGYFFYDPVRNKLYLRMPDESTMIGGYAPGSANVINNGKIVLYCANTSVEKTGNSLTIKWCIALKSYFNGNTCTASMQVTSKTGLSDQVEQMGFYNTQPNPAPMNLSLTPITGTYMANMQFMLEAVYWDPSGFSNIRSCYLMLNSGTATSGAGYYFYDPAKNKLYLRKPDEAVMIGGYAPGAPDLIYNGKVYLSCDRTTVVKEGNTITINWAVSATSYFIGSPCVASMQVTNFTGQSDPMQQMGIFTIEPNN